MKNMEAVCFVVGVFGVIHSSTYPASTAPACTSRPADSQIVTQLMLYSRVFSFFHQYSQRTPQNYIGWT